MMKSLGKENERSEIIALHAIPAEIFDFSLSDGDIFSSLFFARQIELITLRRNNFSLKYWKAFVNANLINSTEKVSQLKIYSFRSCYIWFPF